MPDTTKISEIICTQVAAAIGLDADEVTPESSLVNDLGAESLDLLDMLFRIEKKAGVKIAMADITGRLQGSLSNEEFLTPEGFVSSAGLRQLKTTLRQIDVEELEGKLDSSSIFSLFTVQNLIEMATERIEAEAA